MHTHLGTEQGLGNEKQQMGVAGKCWLSAWGCRGGGGAFNDVFKHCKRVCLSLVSLLLCCGEASPQAGALGSALPAAGQVREMKACLQAPAPTS